MWKPRINCAAAASRDEFCIALTELEYDDPFSAIISYDGRLQQPWGRTDVQREINSVCVTADHHSGKPAQYAALSNEGDVYFLGTKTTREKIPGAGIQSPDAKGLGATFDIAMVNGNLWVTGANRQLYERQGANDWARIPLTSPSVPDSADGDTVDLSAILELGQGEALILGISRSAGRPSAVDTDENLRTSDNWDDWLSAIESDSKKVPEPAGVLFHHKESKWLDVEIPNTKIPTDIYKSSTNDIWIVGYEGSILRGSLTTGFSEIAFHGDRDKNLLSITEFSDRMVIASDYALHWFDGHLLTPLKPKIDQFVNRNVPTPLKVQAVGDLLFYFDYKHGVHRFDGENWEQIVIPPELLERDFKGLRQ